MTGDSMTRNGNDRTHLTRTIQTRRTDSTSRPSVTARASSSSSGSTNLRSCSKVCSVGSCWKA